MDPRCPRCSSLAAGRYCSNCGQLLENAGTALRAVVAASPAPVETRRGPVREFLVCCPRCGRGNPPEAMFDCPRCGAMYLCRTHRDLKTGACEDCRGPSATAAPSAPNPDGMIEVPAGAFRFGPEDCMTEVDRFYMDRTPVTNAAYARFVTETGHRPPLHWRKDACLKGKELHPVVGVSLSDAEAYAAWLGKSLPTEEEWEKAARGPQGRRYPWGDDFVPSRCNTAGSRFKDTTPVELFQEGASPYGILDLAGNVWEWSTSLFAPESPFVVVRGGSWYDPPVQARAFVRLSARPGYRGSCVGFRCVKR